MVDLLFETGKRRSRQRERQAQNLVRRSRKWCQSIFESRLCTINCTRCNHHLSLFVYARRMNELFTEVLFYHAVKKKKKKKKESKQPVEFE
jgi:hypothetical protein